MLKADDAAFTPATDAVLMFGAEFDDTTPDSVDEGDAGALRMSARRELYVQLRDAAGNERGLNVDASGRIGITDGAGNISIDWGGTVPPIGAGLEATALRVTLATDSTGLLSVDDNAGSLTIDNAALSVTGGGLEATALRVTLASDSTGLISVDDNAGSLTIDNATLSVTGTGLEATALRVTIATDSTGVLSVDDNAGALTVDNAGTFAVQVDGGALTALQLIDDVVHSGDAVLSKYAAVGAVFDDTTPIAVTENQAQSLRMSAQRGLYVQLRDAAGNERGLNVDASGNIGVTDAAGSLTIDNAALAVVGGGLEATALRVTIASDSTGVLSVDDNGSTLSIDDGAGNISVDWAGTAPPIGAGLEATALRVTIATDSTGLLSVDDNAGSLTIDNAALAVVGGGLEATALRVTLASDSTGVLSIDDNGGALTIDGSVTLLAADGVDIGNVDVASIVPGTGATNLGKAEDAAHTSADVGIMALAVRNDARAALTSLTLDYSPIAVASDGSLWNVGTYAEDAAHISADNGVFVLAIRDDTLGASSGTEGDYEAFHTNANGALWVEEAASTNTKEVVGDVAHDAAAAGNPIIIAGVAQSTDDTAPPNRISAEGDATRLATDWDGTVFAHPHGPQIWSYHENSSSALTDAAVHAAPGVGLSLYVTDIVVSTGAATAFNVFFEEGASTVLGPYYLEAIAGRGLSIQFQTPKKITANTALTVTTSAAIAHGIDVLGYTAPG